MNKIRVFIFIYNGVIFSCLYLFFKVWKIVVILFRFDEFWYMFYVLLYVLFLLNVYWSLKYVMNKEFYRC